jgi:multidrug transporter EmrE-like cation transporter
MDLFGRLWELFWTIWPKNYIALVLLAAFCEIGSVSAFKFSANRGWLSIVGYILGFFVVAFYGEALRYSKVVQSYPLWIAAVAILLIFASFLIFHEKISWAWFVGFTLIIVGSIVVNIKSSL